VKSKEEQIIKASSNLVTQKDGLKVREDALAKREQEIKVREEAVSIKDRELSSMPYDDMKRMKDENTIKETEIRNKESEISLLRAKLDEAQKSLQARADELGSTKIEYDASLSKLKAKEEVIAKKDEELQILKVKIETRERELAIRESEFDRKAGPVHSHARAEERAHKLIERLKMSKEMDEKMEAQKSEETVNEVPVAMAPTEPEPRPQPQPIAPAPSPVPEPRPSIPPYLTPPYLTPKPKEPRPQSIAPLSPAQDVKAQPQPSASVPPPERPSIPMYLTPRPKEQRPQPPPPSKLPEERPIGSMPAKEQSRSQRDIVDGIFRSAIAETKADVSAPKIPTGIDRLDELLAGGVPAGTMVLMSAEAYVGCDTFIHDLVSHILDEGMPVMYISTRRGVDEVYSSLSSRNERVADYAATGLIKWIDLFSPAPVRVPFLQHVSTMRLEVTSMTEIFLQVDSRASSGGMIIVDSASPLIARGKFEVFVRDIASCVKKIKGVAIFRIEAGMHQDQDIENLKNIIHACISFKKDGTKTLLMVEGISGAKTGNWIEYQIKDGNIILGSFALERIS
jgi:KaiC/GvpD/RAD55 family RecA-like ATPase